MAERPRYRVVAKSKQSGNFQDIMAFWEGEKGISGQLDREVASITLKSGAVISGESVWFNLQDSETERPAAQSDEVPF